MTDRWGDAVSCVTSLAPGALVVADERVLRLHPRLARALRSAAPLALLPMRAGERAKSLGPLARVLAAGANLPRSGRLLCIGGGTLGDLATVAAHLIKRGVSLVQLPTTLLAAVDSSLGGKGAIHVEAIKNAAGVFHEASETWLCPELFETLKPKQLREGEVEAYKMAVCLDERLWERWSRALPERETLIRRARALKARVCRSDPFERTGERAILNFGHTFGHVIESVTHFKVSHGDAVAMGILCALDVGVAMGVTAPLLRESVEAVFEDRLGAPGRNEMAAALAQPDAGAETLAALLGADKKDGQMVLLEAPGRMCRLPLESRLWKRLLKSWARGVRP